MFDYVLNKGLSLVVNEIGNHFETNNLRLFDYYQVFLSPQVKRSSTITYEHGIYELPHKLPNDAAGGAVPTQEKNNLKL